MRKANFTKYYALVGIIGGLLVAFSGHYLYQKNMADKFVQEAKDRQALLSFSKQVWDLWKRGIYSELYTKNCEKLVSEREGMCNASLLECVLKSSPLKLMKKGGGSVKLLSVSALENTDGTKVLLELGKARVAFRLEHSCHKLFLPERIYAYGDKKVPEEDEKFDTFGRKIFIDKYPTVVKGKTFLEIKKNCRDRGMQLLESHLLDAASFHPVDLRNTRPRQLLRPPYPWGRNEKSEYLYKAQNNPNFEFKKSFCELVKTKECEKSSLKALPSWMGLINPLGGEIEVVRNIIFPDQRIVPSSIYFDIHSSWHRLGLRGMWSGNSFDSRDFSFGEREKIQIEDFSEIAFSYRCMQEVWR